MIRVPTIPLERMQLERIVTLNIVEKKDDVPKMRINPNIPMPNLLKQQPKEPVDPVDPVDPVEPVEPVEQVRLEIKEREHKEGDMKYC